MEPLRFINDLKRTHHFFTSCSSQPDVKVYGYYIQEYCDFKLKRETDCMITKKVEV